MTLLYILKDFGIINSNVCDVILMLYYVNDDYYYCYYYYFYYYYYDYVP